MRSMTLSLMRVRLLTSATLRPPPLPARPRVEGFARVAQRGDEWWQVRLVSRGVREYERDFKARGPRLGSQARGSVGEPALAQRASDRQGECGELDHLALMKVLGSRQ